MRILLIYLLAVGALAGDVQKKLTKHKQVKRGFIPTFGFVNGEQESSQDFVYDQSNTEYQNAAYGSLGLRVSGYKSGLQYNAASLPVHQQTTYSSNMYDNHGGQNSVYQVEQESDLAGGAHQLGRGVQVSVPSPYSVQVRRPVEVPVSSPVPVYVNKLYAVHIDRPVPVSVPAPYEERVPVQISVPHSVPVQVPHEGTVQVSHHEPVQVGYQESVQFAHHQEPVHIGSGYEEQTDGQHFGAEDAFYGQSDVNEQQVIVSENNASLGNLAQFEHLNVGAQHYNFGNSELESDLASAHHNSETVHHHQQPTHKGSSVSKNGSGGYVYNIPDKKFTV